MVRKHLTHEFVEQSVGIVYNFNALAQSNEESKHKKLFYSDANALDLERTAHDQNTLNNKSLNSPPNRTMFIQKVATCSSHNSPSSNYHTIF
jgi:hypothetical protein